MRDISAVTKDPHPIYIASRCAAVRRAVFRIIRQPAGTWATLRVVLDIVAGSMRYYALRGRSRDRTARCLLLPKGALSSLIHLMVEQSFNYDFHRTRDWKHYSVYLQRFRDRPTPILDLGCGIGLFLEACRESKTECVGVELEPEGVAECRRKGFLVFEHDLSKPLTFLDDESFAGVFANQVIEHLEPAGQVSLIEEAFRVLQPGGQVQITSPCRHWEPARRDKYHVGLLTPSELRKLVEVVGFVGCNMGYNRPQRVPGVPEEVVDDLWRRYHPDLLSQTATVIAKKPSR